MEFTKELANKTLGSSFRSLDWVDDMYVIMYDNKLFIPKQGRMFHETREDAVKHFYNEFCWRSRDAYKKHYFGVNWWDSRKNIDLTDRQIWNEFKKTLNEDCKFEIIKWKYAKRDVCGEGRAEGDC